MLSVSCEAVGVGRWGVGSRRPQSLIWDGAVAPCVKREIIWGKTVIKDEFELVTQQGISEPCAPCNFPALRREECTFLKPSASVSLTKAYQMVFIYSSAGASRTHPKVWLLQPQLCLSQNT